jgi:hypothetical protein
VYWFEAIYNKTLVNEVCFRNDIYHNHPHAVSRPTKHTLQNIIESTGYPMAFGRIKKAEAYTLPLPNFAQKLAWAG